jgi:hypothetical protein
MMPLTNNDCLYNSNFIIVSFFGVIFMAFLTPKKHQKTGGPLCSRLSVTEWPMWWVMFACLNST